MNIFSIYKATNKINNKIYIGFDSKWPRRQINHIRNAFKCNEKDYNTLLHRSMRKYGIDNFKWEEVCCSKDGEYLLNIIEPYFIKYYDSFGKNGYNMTLGGEGKPGHKPSLESRQKMSKSGKGRKQSKEHIEKRMKFHIGSKRSNITKNKISITAKNRPPNRISNYILIDPENKEHYITNLTKFCRDNPQLNIKSSSLITISKRNKRYKGWIIKY